MTAVIRRIAVAGAAAAALCAFAYAPANADASERWIAIAYSDLDKAAGIATGATEAEASQRALSGCEDANVDGGCAVRIVNDGAVDPPCVALANSATNWGLAEGETEADVISGVDYAVPPSDDPLRIVSGCANFDATDTGTSGTAETATVIQDVDIYDVPDGVGTPYSGVFLDDGEQYDLVEPCRENWCHLYIDFIPGGTGWAYQDGFLDVS